MVAKKSAKKSTKKAAAPSAITIKLTRAHQAQAKDCLAKSGKIRLSMKEVSLTRLPASLKPNLVIVD